ncbi:MAG: hypothetical protein ACI379_14510 [Nocardioides sp.]|uniref:hypothetical protein n=1 Tax=Nocardioides sp. TaxID=35761 RepID=UPI003EFBDC85
MADTGSSSLLGTLGLVLLGVVAVWIIWTALSIVWGLVKLVLTLVVLGAVVYGAMRLLSTLNSDT